MKMAKNLPTARKQKKLPLKYLTSAILLFFAIFCKPAYAHHLVLSTGYANSQSPQTGIEVDRNSFRSGGGYAFSTRMDIEKRNFWIGPSFTFWNNLTGDPDPNANASYFQIELGGRLLYRTHTIPSLYGGVGVGYTFAQGQIKPKYVGDKEEFDGDFPTGSLHFGLKTPSQTTGLGFVAETSYSFGLDDPRGVRSIGPAKAWMISIGILFDTAYRIK